MALNSEVGAFLERAAAKRFAYGSHDCLLFAADWIQQQTGEDPAAPWRGKYRTRIGALRVVSKAGGMVALMDSRGLPRTDDPMTGDVGAVRGLTSVGDEICGAIRVGNRWAGLCALGGVLVGPAQELAAWRVDG